MSQEPALLYLDLIKKTLSFTLWKEPGIPLETFNYRNPPIKRTLVNAISKVAHYADLELVKHVEIADRVRTDGMFWPMQADTMIGLKRLENIQECVTRVLDDNIPGDLIETGVWRGGACIFMRAILAAYNNRDRRVFVADSFQGLPKPEGEYAHDADDRHFTEKYLAVSQQEVEGNFRKYDLLDKQVVFLKGWFKDTLPVAPIEQLAVMRLDGDMYQSTWDGLTNLYPKLSVGGYCIIDDYGAVPGCKQAVDDYREEHGIGEPVQQIDWTGVFWRKEIQSRS